ncbi:MAG: MFS transporter [Oscillospiraceae bacterium]|jgi:OFA family oxalate/formate antiporter-like MFS transporter
MSETPAAGGKGKMHYAWKIVIACILVKLGVEGAVAACMGNFITPIVTDLGCKVSELTMYTSINAISMALLYTVAAKVLTRKKIGLVMGIAATVQAVSICAMGTFNNVHLFYITGATIGASNAFTGFVALPIIINMWFKKKNGTVLGSIVAIGSAASVGYSYLSAALISGYGWRRAYFVLGIMAFVISVPAILIWIRRPEEVGVTPYGATDAEAEEMKSDLKAASIAGITKKQAFRLPFVYIAWIACILISYGCGVPYYINTFCTMELGQSITFGAMAQICLMLGTMLSSIIVGRINDRISVQAGLAFGAVMNALGFGLMFASFRNPVYAYPASFIVGLGNSMYTVQCPLLAQHVVGQEHYSEIWSVMMMANSLIGGGLFSTIGAIYDNTGTYRGAFVMTSVLFFIALILGCIAMNMSTKYRRKMAEQE